MKAVVSSLKPVRILEIRGLDCLTRTKEVEKGIKRDLPDVSNLKMGVGFVNCTGQRFAIITVPRKTSGKLLNYGKIKMRWIICRRSKDLSTVHTAHSSGLQRTRYKCGESGYEGNTQFEDGRQDKNYCRHRQHFDILKPWLQGHYPLTFASESLVSVVLRWRMVEVTNSFSKYFDVWQIQTG